MKKKYKEPKIKEIRLNTEFLYCGSTIIEQHRYGDCHGECGYGPSDDCHNMGNHNGKWKSDWED